MAENEAKARKKLEDAEKKAKGGSGFLSGLFGNAKAEEAADLFVQVSVLQLLTGNLDQFICLVRHHSSIFESELVFHVDCENLLNSSQKHFWILILHISFQFLVHRFM